MVRLSFCPACSGYALTLPWSTFINTSLNTYDSASLSGLIGRILKRLAHRSKAKASTSDKWFLSPTEQKMALALLEHNSMRWLMMRPFKCAVRASTRVIAMARSKVLTTLISNEWHISLSLRILGVSTCNASFVKPNSAEVASSLTLLKRPLMIC